MILLRQFAYTLWVIFVVLSSPSWAQSTNDTDKAGGRRGWVSGSNDRSTSDILWSCFSVFLVCTWRCMHMNLPNLAESEAGWHTAWGWFPYCPTLPLFKIWFRKVNAMFIIAVAPEVGVGMAVTQFIEAKHLGKVFQNKGFTITHGFYTYMGGYAIAVPGPKEEEEEKEAATKKDQALTDVEARPPCPPKIYILRPRDLVTLDELDLFPATNVCETHDRSQPAVTEEDILDRSKSDAFTKLFALLQCGWLIIQSIARASSGLPLTELELSTLAFIICSLIMYGFWWNKPFDVHRPTILICPDYKAKRLRKTLDRRESDVLRQKDFTLDYLATNLRGSWVILDEFGLFYGILTPLLFYLTAVAFSGLHVIAWHWEFPSATVQTLWRVFSLTATTSSLTFLALLVPSHIFKKLAREENKGKARDYVVVASGVVLVLSLIAYIISRLGLIVLVFYCFRSMPAAVYSTVNWNDVFPHFS